MRCFSQQRGQATIEWAGVAVVVAVLVTFVITFGAAGWGAQVTHGIECAVDHIFGKSCTASVAPGSTANPYQVVCQVQTSTNAANLDVKIAFVRVSDNSTLVKMTYSDGSSQFILTHTGTAQAEAAIGAEFNVGSFGGEAMASAAAGGFLAGAQEWDFANAAQTAAFEKQIQGHGGWGTIAHDIANGIPLVGPLAGGLLNLVGVHGDSGLPSPTDVYVKGGLTGAVKAGVNGGVGVAAANLDAELKAALGARVTVSSANKSLVGQTQVYLQLDGNAAGNLQTDLFGPDSIKGGANAGAIGQAVVAVTLSPSGEPLSAKITAYGGYTAGLGSKNSVSGPNAAAISEALKKASLKLSDGQGYGVQWSGTIDLGQHPGAVADLASAISGSSPAVQQVINDFNNEGTQQIQPFALSRSTGGAGVEGDFGIGVGADGSSTNMTQSYTPGEVKPPGLAWGPMVCTK